ncbi:hypothetical protein N7452_007874 [Penicillium brevicompactum]|uniref:Uncharacterized protein n=1 Tax=Penicillium brevicompactum TaxID=5074 RepID=A0A9W9UEE4_PENBR|nr:hypothetical protein N7452_007874 [Penicillium brevicompactum]
MAVPQPTNAQQILAPQDDTYSPVEEPGHHNVGVPFTIPQTIAGAGQTDPGEWAKLVKTLPWKVAQTAKLLKTSAISVMVQSPSRREPSQRTSTPYTGMRLHERVSASAANVESILIQTVGEISQQECQSCLKGHGPWARCIRFHNIDRTVTACGNCQWNGHKGRCDFYQPPVGGAKPKGRKRARLSAFSLGDQPIRRGGDVERAAALEDLEKRIRQLQTRMYLDSSRLAFVRVMMAQANASDSIPDIRANLPTTTADEIKAEFDHILGLVEQMRLADRAL